MTNAVKKEELVWPERKLWQSNSTPSIRPESRARSGTPARVLAPPRGGATTGGRRIDEGVGATSGSPPI